MTFANVKDYETHNLLKKIINQNEEIIYVLKHIYQHISSYCDKECHHQDDGNTCHTNTPQVKCKKCGEFYK